MIKMNYDELYLLTLLIIAQCIAFLQPVTNPVYMIWFPTIVLGLCVIILLIIFMFVAIIGFITGFRRGMRLKKEALKMQEK